MFGKTMMIECPAGMVKLKPFEKEEIANKKVVEMLSDKEVTQYLNTVTSPTVEDEAAWWEKTRNNDNTIIWGIYLNDSELLGNTSLCITSPNHSATSGFLIFDKTYWKKGLASTSHIARTFYATHLLNLKTITSSVFEPNIGSFKALKSVGYFETGYIFGSMFINGKFRGQRYLQWIHPEHATIFFEGNTPEHITPALELAEKTLERAKKDVIF